MLKRMIWLTVAVLMAIVLLVGCDGESDNSGDGKLTETGSEQSGQNTIDGEISDNDPDKVTVWLRSETIDNNGNVVSSSKYDDNGNVLESVHGFGDGKMVTKCKYDVSGNLVEIEHIDASGRKYVCLCNNDGIVIQKTVYEGETREVYKYDDQERLIEKTGYYKDGTETNTYKYDDNGNLVEESEKDSFSNGREQIKTKRYKYDSHNNIVEHENLKYIDGTQKSYSKIVYKNKYDDKGNCTEIISYDEEGEIESQEQFKYDENGNKTEYISKYDDGSGGHCTYKYDAQGRETEKRERSYDKDGQLFSDEYDTHKYDDQGREIEKRERSYDKDGQIKSDTCYTYRYDDQGRKIEESVCANGVTELVFSCKYDDKGNKIEENGNLYVHDESGKLLKAVYSDGRISEYKYDEYGNLIETKHDDEVTTYKYVKIEVSPERAEDINENGMSWIMGIVYN